MFPISNKTYFILRGFFWGGGGLYLVLPRYKMTSKYGSFSQKNFENSFYESFSRFFDFNGPLQPFPLWRFYLCIHYKILISILRVVLNDPSMYTQPTLKKLIFEGAQPEKSKVIFNDIKKLFQLGFVRRSYKQKIQIEFVLDVPKGL